jgi:hypothetical protein
MTRKRPAHRGGKKLHSSVRGVTFENGSDRTMKPWKAYFYRDGLFKNLGRFSSEEAAIACVQTHKNQ